MAKSANQKLKLLLLRQLLLTGSDEDHPIPTAQLIEALARQGVHAERKSIYDDMETLRLSGLDVQLRRERPPGWFVGAREFELAELKLLVDAVQSSRFITRRKSDTLIRKLEGLASRYQAGQLQRQVYVSGQVKADNEGIYYNVDQLHAAIAAGQGVRFRYFDYNSRKQKVYRRDGAQYTVTPYGLVWDNQNYYLVGLDAAHGDVRHYRVDKMSGIEPAPPAGGAPAPFDMAGYAQKHFGMFSGDRTQVRLRCAEGLAGVVLDRFGQQAILAPDGPEHFTVMVDVVVSPQFWGWLFGLGEGVQLLSPHWAVQEYRARLLAVSAHYGA